MRSDYYPLMQNAYNSFFIYGYLNNTPKQSPKSDTVHHKIWCWNHFMFLFFPHVTFYVSIFFHFNHEFLKLTEKQIDS